MKVSMLADQWRLTLHMYMYLKWCFGSWKCKDNFEIKDAKRCFLTQFEMVFWELELLRKF